MDQINKNFFVFFIIILFFGYFYFVNKADASEIIDLNSLDGYATTTSYSHFDGGVQSFFPDQTNISKFSIYELDSLNNCSANYVASDCPNAIITLCKGVYSNDYNCENNTFIASTTQKYVCGWNDFIFPTRPILVQGDAYFITFQGHSGSCFAEAVAMTNDYRSGIGFDKKKFYNIGDGGFQASPSGFKTYYYTDYNIMSIAIPATGGTFKDFPYFQIDYSSSQSFASGTTMQIQYYNKASSSILYSDISSTFIHPIMNGTFLIKKTTFLDNGLWFASGYMVDNTTGDILASSTEISFWINNETGSSAFSGTSTALLGFTGYQSAYATICNDVATSTGGFDDFRYGIECGFKKIILWAFYPNTDSLNALNASFGMFKTQFPFSAYFGLTDAINSSIASSTTNMSGSIKMPMIDKTGHYYMLPVVASSSMPNLIGQTNTNLFRTTMGWLLWAGAGFVIFITFKKI